VDILFRLVGAKKLRPIQALKQNTMLKHATYCWKKL